MKLHITITDRTTRDARFEYDGDDLSALELERLVRVWLMAATDSITVTQQVIDNLTAKLRSHTDGLLAVVESVAHRVDEKEG